MQQISFRVEKLICLFLVLNAYRNTEEFSDEMYVTIILLLFGAKLYKERANIKIIPLILAIMFTFLEIALRMKQFYVLTSIFSLFVFFYPIRHYKLPAVPSGVGYKHFYLPEKYGGLEAIIMYPIVDEVAKIQVNWLRESFIGKMYYNSRVKYQIPYLFYKLIISYMRRYVMIFSHGKLKACDDVIIFSHGRGADLHSYTTILSHLVANNRIIISVQHSQKIKLTQQEVKNQKAFREKEIPNRSSQINTAFDFMLDDSEREKLFGTSTSGERKPQRYFYMGHSYGGSTVIEACFTSKNKSKISGVIILDPWLVPLRNERLKENIEKPLISIENQIFTRDIDISKRNKEFMDTNKENGIQFNLKGADHLHQCDLCFIIGNFMRIVPKSEDSLKYLGINLRIINEFLSNCQKLKKMELQKEIRKNNSDIFL